MALNQKRVLVVDDEPAVRDLMQALVRHIGHEVETVESGAEALDRIEGNEFDLVFTDLIMPGMKGDALAREIKMRRPALPVVLLTGHKPERVSPDFSLVLAKPFTRDDLRRVIAALT
jgi:CheY-like chemotaxis protein